jgi:glucokinase
MPSGDYPSLQAFGDGVSLKVKMPIERACFDVVGPAINGRMKVTNLPWRLMKFRLQGI